jgi:hypothetical protein
VAEVKALACEPPAGSGKPLARWTCPELARQAAAAGIVAPVSAFTVRSWLASGAIKPWQHRSWIFPRDPHFALKGGRVLDLTPDDFGDLDSLAEEILAFERHYNTTARPFDWKFTRAGLNQLLGRISRHDPLTPQPLAA